MNKNIILVFAVLISILVLLFSIFSIQLYPLNNMHTTERITEFRFTGFANKVLIDDNPDFTSPVIIEKPFMADLEPGIYYWKTNLLSPTRAFTIDSAVAINLLKKENQTYTVQNKGNTMIDLIVRNIKDWTITGKAVLEINEETNVKIENNSAVEAAESSHDTTGNVIALKTEKIWTDDDFIVILIICLSVLTFTNIVYYLSNKKLQKSERFK